MLIRSQHDLSTASRVERSIDDLAATGDKWARAEDHSRDPDKLDAGSADNASSSNEEEAGDAEDSGLDDNLTQAFKKMKAMADDDHIVSVCALMHRSFYANASLFSQFSKCVGKGQRWSDKTNDVRLIFKDHTRTNPATGLPQKGHLCDGCQ